MNEAFYIVVIVLLIILQIVIIWKFFQMARNINSIRKSKYTESLNFDYEFKFLFLNGYKDEAKRFLLVSMWDDPDMETLITPSDIINKETGAKKLASKYKKYFEMLGEQFPDYIKME